MQFSLVSDPTGTSLHDHALMARNELVAKLLDHWAQLSEVQLLYYEPGNTNAVRLPQALHCVVEDHDHYTPSVDDEGIDGDDKLYLQHLEELNLRRAAVAKELADALIRACQDAYEGHPQARTFEARIMVFDSKGAIETGATQKLPASSLGLRSPASEPPEDDLEHLGEPLGELVSTIKRLVAANATVGDQMRVEKADIHQRYIELTDRNMGMLSKFQELVGMALTHSRLPPEHYELETTKLQMRNEFQRAAMDANTRTAMAHERQQTVQAFIKENPNFLQDLLATAASLYQQRHGAPPSDSPPGTNGDSTAPKGSAAGTRPPYDTTATPGPSRGPGPKDVSEASAPPPDGDTPSLCRGSQKLHELLDPSTIAAMESALAPDHWRALSPLLSCTDEAEFRRHIGVLTAALSELPQADLIKFQLGLLKSIPPKAQKPLSEFLGSYGLQIH